MARHCRRCKKHGILSPLKGHKGKCLFSECSCDFCTEIERQNALQKQVYGRRELNENEGETDLGSSISSRGLDLLHAANNFYQAQKDDKNKTVLERKQDEIKERNYKRDGLYRKANEILSSLPSEFKARSPILNLGYAYKTAGEMEHETTYQRNARQGSAMLVTPIHGRLNESFHRNYKQSCTSSQQYTPTFQIAPNKPEKSPSVNGQFDRFSSKVKFPLLEQLQHASAENQQAVDTLTDIYPNQDRSLLESVLETFNFNLSEAVNWFDDVPPENIQSSRSSAADISTQGWNLNFDAQVNENEALHSENTSETQCPELLDFETFITGLDRNTSSKSDKSAVPNRPTSAASTSVRSECTPVAANSLSNSDRSAVPNRSGFSASTWVSESTPVTENEARPRRVLFSIENLLNSTPKGQPFGGHKGNNTKSVSHLRPNCLSFSKTPLAELKKMQQDFIKETKEDVGIGAKRKSSAVENSSDSPDRICRFCSRISNELFCPGCGSLLNKRGRYWTIL